MKSKKLIDEFKRHFFLENGGSDVRVTNLSKTIFISRYGLDGRLHCSSRLAAQELNHTQVSVWHNCRAVMSTIMPSIAAEKYYAQFRSACSLLLEKIFPLVPGSAEDISQTIGVPKEEILFVCRISKLIGLSPSIHVGFAGILTLSHQFRPSHKCYSAKANSLSVKGFFTLTEYSDAIKIKFPKISRTICKAILDAKYVHLHSDIVTKDSGESYSEHWYFVPGTKNRILDAIKKRIFTFGKCSFSIFDELKVHPEFIQGLLSGSGLTSNGVFIKADNLSTKFQFSPTTSKLIRILKKLGGLTPSHVLTRDFYIECEKNGISKKVAGILTRRESIFHFEGKYCWIKF